MLRCRSTAPSLGSKIERIEFSDQRDPRVAPQSAPTLNSRSPLETRA